MSVLPGPEELGQVNPGSGERPIGQINATPIARGAEALGAGVAKIGGALGELEERKSRYDFALAHGGFLSDLIGLNATTSRDPNYGPDSNGQDLSQRYQEQANALRDKWASSIGSPAMRERFTQTVMPQIAHGIAGAGNRAFGLERDHNVAALDTLGETLGNQAAATDDPAMHAQVMDSFGNAVEGAAGRGFLTEDQAFDKKRRFGAALAGALLIHQGETDPLGALNHVRAAPGSDAELVERIAQIESGGNPLAQSGSSRALGLGQFEPATWLPLIRQLHPDLASGRSDADLLALRADPNLSREAMGALLTQNRAALSAQGVEPSAGNLYLAHFLGAGGAAKVLAAKPDTPVADLLDAKQIAANPAVLGGKTAGSVAQWAADKMGGYQAGTGSIYSFIPPQQRAQLESRLLAQVHSKVASDLSDFKQRYQDTLAEAQNLGAATAPLAQEDFVRAYGPDRAAQAYQDYQGELQLGADVQRVAGMKGDEQQALLASYAPKPGTGYAAAVKRQGLLGNAIAQSNQQRTQDPAGFAVQYLPAAKESWNSFAGVLANPQASDDDKRAAARDFAIKTTMEQQRVGIPNDNVRIVPKAYSDAINKQFVAAADADEPQARTRLIDQVQREAAMWGDAWPQVMRQLAPTAQPVVRAIAAGADATAMTRLLSLPKDEAKKPATILAQQNDTKFKDLTSSLNDAMAPFRRTLVGRQGDRDFPGYYDLAKELGALYARDGLSANDAAAKAFGDLIGNRYEFRDTWRMPKSAGVTVDDVQAGTIAARGRLASFGVKAPADDMPGRPGATDTDLGLVRRDARFITAADNSGLSLVYDTKDRGPVMIRSASTGQPLVLNWQQLATLGRNAPRAAPDMLPTP
jgi:hypothetical protein